MVKQMTDTTKDWNDVNDAVTNQIKELEAVEAQLENIQEALDDADKAITAAEEKVAALPPVGTDVDTINQQMEDLKVCLYVCVFYAVKNKFYQLNGIETTRDNSSVPVLLSMSAIDNRYGPSLFLIRIYKKKLTVSRKR